MIARVHGSILQGIDAIGCEVEADVTHEGRTSIYGASASKVSLPA